MISDFDPNGTGLLAYNDFLRLMDRRLKAAPPEDRLAEAFNIFDRDGNGFVSAEELRIVMVN